MGVVGRTLYVGTYYLHLTWTLNRSDSLLSHGRKKLEFEQKWIFMCRNNLHSFSLWLCSPVWQRGEEERENEWKIGSVLFDLVGLGAHRGPTHSAKILAWYLPNLCLLKQHTPEFFCPKLLSRIGTFLSGINGYCQYYTLLKVWLRIHVEVPLFCGVGGGRGGGRRGGASQLPSELLARRQSMQLRSRSRENRPEKGSSLQFCRKYQEKYSWGEANRGLSHHHANYSGHQKRPEFC